MDTPLETLAEFGSEQRQYSSDIVEYIVGK